ncbi:UPF0272 protein [Spirochaetia bacterium]|nr:UPF0272 protein [Spirochaetia bacterium]
MKTLHFDCFAGISGDMTLGALVDLGVNADELTSELNKLNLKGWSIEFFKDERCGITGTRAVVKDQTHRDGDTPHNAHTHWSEIRSLIEKSALSGAIKKRSIKIFDLIAGAEAEVHGVEKENVAFHEVGAIDSIIDIVGAACAIEQLKPDKITAGAVELGGGFVKCAHGTLPVPAPATLLLCRGMPVKTGGFDKEMTTPTGAGILAACVDEFITGENNFKEIKSAYGIGNRKLDKPNVLRVSWRTTFDKPLCENSKALCANNFIEEKLVLIETNIDDMTGESFGFLMDKLFETGALDVTFTPCVMKKSRPGTIVSVLCRCEHIAVLRKTLFKHSTTIGLRESIVNRVSLQREQKKVTGDFGEALVKTVNVDAQTKREKIEFDDRARIANKTGASLDEAKNLIRKGTL